MNLPGPVSAKKDYIPVFFFLFTAVFLAYAPIIRDPLIRDDYWLLGQVKNIGILQLWRLAYAQIIYFRPLGELFYWLQWRLFGIDALPSHIFSLGLLALDACLLFWLLQLLGQRRLTAFFAALLFALAPIDVESVTWSAVRFDLAALSFMLMSLGFYYIFLRDGSPRAYLLALLLALAAMMIKEPAMILVVMIPIMEIIYHGVGQKAGKGGRPGFRAAPRRWLPLLGVFFVYLSLRFAVLGGIGGATSVVGRPSLRASYHSAFAFLFPLSWLETGPDRAAWALAFFLVAGLLGAGLLRALLKPRRQSSRRAIIFFGLFFLISLAPVFPFVFITGVPQSLATSRYFFIPYFAFIAMIIIMLFDIFSLKRLLYIAVTVLSCLAIFDVWAIHRNNQPWERAAAVSGYILAQTQRLVPQPKPGAVFYYRGIPVMSGYLLFQNLTLEPALRIEYQRNDIRVCVEGDKCDKSLLDGAYVFRYESGRNNLILLSAPPAGVSPVTRTGEAEDNLR